MKEYVSPSRKVIKYHRSHLLESENRKHFPLYKQRAPQCSETLPAYLPGPRLLSGRAIRNMFITPSPCTQLSHPALKNAWTRVLFKLQTLFSLLCLSKATCELWSEELSFLQTGSAGGERTLLTNSTTWDSTELFEPVIHWATFRTCEQRKKDQNCLQLYSASILPPTLQLSG